MVLALKNNEEHFLRGRSIMQETLKNNIQSGEQKLLKDVY